MHWTRCLGTARTAALPFFQPLHKGRNRDSLSALTPDSMHELLCTYTDDVLSYKFGQHTTRSTVAKNALANRADLGRVRELVRGCQHIDHAYPRPPPQPPKDSANFKVNY
jgi:hypothetical protein